MKRLSILILMMGVVLVIDVKAQMSVSAKDYAYVPTYSASFKIGSPTYSKMILDLWKDWDDNKFDRHDYFADTVSMFFPDGTMSKGKKECMDGAIKYRGSMSSEKSIIHAWLPLRSTDRNEDVVCVWGQ